MLGITDLKLCGRDLVAAHFQDFLYDAFVLAIIGALHCEVLSHLESVNDEDVAVLANLDLIAGAYPSTGEERLRCPACVKASKQSNTHVSRVLAHKHNGKDGKTLTPQDYSHISAQQPDHGDTVPQAHYTPPVPQLRLRRSWI